jgi:hypothetical protein
MVDTYPDVPCWLYAISGRLEVLHGRRINNINVRNVLAAVSKEALAFAPRVIRVSSTFEMFSGSAGITACVQNLGLLARSFDRTSDPDDDFCTILGFLLAVFHTLSVVVGGLLFASPQCSTWLQLCKGHTKRHLDIFGDEGRTDVDEANCCAIMLRLG